MKALLAMDAPRRDVLDHVFIDAHTLGFAGLAADLDATDWIDIEAASGLALASSCASGPTCTRSGPQT